MVNLQKTHILKHAMMVFKTEIIPTNEKTYPLFLLRRVSLIVTQKPIIIFQTTEVSVYPFVLTYR